MAKAFPLQITFSNLRLYEQLIREGAWWDFVDDIASNLIGLALQKSPKKMWKVMDRWQTDENLWIRRTTLLCQLKFKERTNEEKLFEYCENLCNEKEFFIRKAIGWALRQYSYVKPDRVMIFLTENKKKLSKLSYREGIKVIKRKKLIWEIWKLIGCKYLFSFILTMIFV